jgi:4-diphosphocytidyl-2-C-methyl-D-erythritol kinase
VKEYLSPAKINLFFKVIKKRKDNYHEIASVYQAISLFDKLSFEKSKKDKFFSTNKSLKFDRFNLIYKAIELFRDKTKIKDSVSIHLEKNIPIMAGLAGGSSNASTTLFALNDLFDRPLSLKQLINLSKKIGADAPFFFSKGSCFCSGIGQTFKNINIKDFEIYIAKPNFGISTKKVFENLNLKNLNKRDITFILNSYLNDKFILFNDLENSSFEVENKMRKIKKDLLDMGIEKILMSGSGSSFICFSDKILTNSNEITFYKVKSIKRKDDLWYSNH